jgi:glycosyltransferase involved in cell wall biosynthesis
MPTYNYARFLPDAIESVLNQTFADFELIIVDNNSTDKTDEVVAHYLNDKRVKYFKNFSNGMVGNWNKCLEYATGDYLKYICSDDKFHPQLLEKFVAVMDQYPNVSVVTSYRGMFGRSDTRVDSRTFNIWRAHQNMTEGQKIIRKTLQTYNWIGEPTAVMIRKSNLFLGYFRPDMSWMPDWEMWLRHLTVGDFYLIPEVLSYIRKHLGSVTETIARKGYANYFEDYRFYKSLAVSGQCQFNLTKVEIEQLVKKSACNCAKAMLKSIPKLHEPIFRNVFINGLKIGFTEKVLTNTLFKLSRNTIKRLTSSEVENMKYQL